MTSEVELPGVTSVTSTIPEIAVTRAATDFSMANRVTVHEGCPEIKAVVEEFPTLWEEGGFAELPEQE